MKVRHKPKVLEARQWVGEVTPKELAAWCRGIICYDGFMTWLEIPTRYGKLQAFWYDWIIEDIDGEFHVYNDKTFKKTYEEAANDQA